MHRRTFVSLAVSTLSSAAYGCGGSSENESPEKTDCDDAVPYRGTALHPPVVEEVFVSIAPDLRGEPDKNLSARLDAAIDDILKKTKAPGITAAVGIPGQGIWYVSRGLAITDPPTPIEDASLFHFASAGKAFTAAVIMQLVREGKLRYEDPLAKWFRDFPNAKAITVEHLLTHTSGIYSFNSGDSPSGRKEYTAPDAAIQIARKHGNLFCPGAYWNYSNTGYTFLGKIVEIMDGKPFHEAVQTRIITPLGLKHTVALAPRQKLEKLATGHIGGKPARDFDLTTPYAAGNIVGRADDQVRFWHAFLSGGLVGTNAITESFKHLYPMFADGSGLFYGRGVMLYEFSDKGHKNNWLGHSGGMPFLKAVAAYDISTKVFVAAAINGDVSAEATANALLKEVALYRDSARKSGAKK
ncbi:MAG: beta-lactamase family protein [Fibrella sp.]|nr:beta-lactamase family protein [Armatimonadota bacterium]